MEDRTFEGHRAAELICLVDGVVVTTPLVSGVVPYDNPRNMTVGGSKGSLCGNFAMEEADLLVAVGTRFVCQSDCSRTGYPKAQHVININADVHAAMHYNKTLALVGDAAHTLRHLCQELRRLGPGKTADSPWLTACTTLPSRPASAGSTARTRPSMS